MRVRYCIYAIIDPRDDGIFYIGQTSSFAARKAQHVEGTDQLSGYLVKQMKLNGYVPLFTVLERTKTKAAALAGEIFWIEMFRTRGARLLNSQAVGGFVGRGKKREELSSGLDKMASSRMSSLEDIANGRSARERDAWTPLEIRRLIGMKTSKMSVEAMADALERTPQSIKSKLKYLRLT